MEIIEQLRQLKLPKGQYIVVGSSLMQLYGLKICNDLDIVVSPELFHILQVSSDWESIPWTYVNKSNGVFLRKGDIEIYLDVNCGDFNPTLSDLLSRAIYIEGFAFASLEDILEFKRRYVLTKPKHSYDIELLEAFLGNL